MAPYFYNFSSVVNKYKFQLILSALYCAIFFCLFYVSRGNLFVMDANESYSSIIHAQSLAKFGFTGSFGLADEAYGLSASAHPFVHSHQGNFPRFFSLIIYSLGAVDVISQVVVTTLSIGLGAYIVGFLFLRHISNQWVAFTCCLILLTDYIFFFQWQIVTYRVWYTFVFFFQFYLIEKYITDSKRVALLLLYFNTLMFCYGELIFAAYLGLFSLSWVAYRGWGSYRVTLSCAAVMAAGLVTSLFILFGQGIAYLGIDNFILDILYTFGARNTFDPTGSSIERISNFYRQNHVVFWENLQSRDTFLTIGMFVKSIFRPFVEVYSPITSILIMTASILILVSSKLVAEPIARAERYCRKQVVSILLCDVMRYILTSVASLLLVTSCIDFLLKFYNFSLSFPVLLILTIEILVVSFIFAMSALADILRYSLASVFFYIANMALLALDLGPYKPLWVFTHGEYLLILLPGIMLCAVSSVCYLDGVLNKVPAPDSIDATSSAKHHEIFYFIGLGTACYGAIYFLSPGYLYSGYTVRYAPFFVFVFDVALGTIFYFYIRLFANTRSIGSVAFAKIIAQLFALLIFIVWFNQQYATINVFKPGHYDVLPKLQHPPYKNSTFIVSTYAAPVALQTGNWAYMDPLISRGQFVSVNGDMRLLGDNRYLWLADKNQNVSYRRPDYYICMIPQDLSNRVSIIRDGYVTGCLDQPLVRLASLPSGKNIGITLLDYDKNGEQSGQISWAIVKFDWDRGLGGGLVWQVDTHVTMDNNTQK